MEKNEVITLEDRGFIQIKGDDAKDFSWLLTKHLPFFRIRSKVAGILDVFNIL